MSAIGTVKNDEKGMFIQLKPEYIPGLKALEEFSFINIIWWFDDCDNNTARNMLQMDQPYKGAPETSCDFDWGQVFTKNFFLTSKRMLTIIFIKW